MPWCPIAGAANVAVSALGYLQCLNNEQVIWPAAVVFLWDGAQGELMPER